MDPKDVPLLRKKKRVKVNRPEVESTESEHKSELGETTENTTETQENNNAELAPKPKPRRRYSEHKITDDGDEAPQPLPRTPTTPEKREISVMVTPPKKRKAAAKKAGELLSNVLRRERKKTTEVATIFKEKNDELEVEMVSPTNTPRGPNVDIQMMYVQSKTGFQPGGWDDVFGMCKNLANSNTSSDRNLLVSAAITFHSIWTRFMHFCHGIIAGIACCHILAVSATLATTRFDSAKFMEFYHFLSLKIHFLVFVFTTMCIVSCYDRLDCFGNFRRWQRVPLLLVITFIYLTCMILTLIAHPYTATIDAFRTDTDGLFTGFYEWHWIVTSRDILLLFAWVLMAITEPSDLLKKKLTTIRNTYSNR